MADAPSTTAAPAEAAPTAGQAPVATQTTQAAAPEASGIEARMAALEAALKGARDEAAGSRIKARETEKAKAEAESRFADALRMEREDRAALAKEYDVAKAQAARADGYEAAIKRRLDATLARLPEAQRSKFAALDPTTALDFAEDFIALTGTPARPAAHATTAGTPAASVAAPPIDHSKLSETQILALPRDQLSAILRTRSGGFK